ncbi:hypothetical protein EVAR_5018_1 [Eumeta japonica]|uniref:Uncharacterized protein n=1 Tax=Eumeta variegata TaxID=151549 RepID=A0A4C1SWN8_EUMVA|nr:hypothetical protein EVAR_5018_1 [Eumeta japonica]
MVHCAYASLLKGYVTPPSHVNQMLVGSFSACRQQRIRLTRSDGGEASWIPPLNELTALKKEGGGIIAFEILKCFCGRMKFSTTLPQFLRLLYVRRKVRAAVALAANLRVSRFDCDEERID